VLCCWEFRRTDFGPVSPAGVAGSRGEDEPGSGFGDLEVQVEQDAGVGVGGEHDAGATPTFRRRINAPAPFHDHACPDIAPPSFEPLI
jgi:hypothetical protein